MVELELMQFNMTFVFTFMSNRRRLMSGLRDNRSRLGAISTRSQGDLEREIGREIGRGIAGSHHRRAAAAEEACVLDSADMRTALGRTFPMLQPRNFNRVDVRVASCVVDPQSFTTVATVATDVVLSLTVKEAPPYLKQVRQEVFKHVIAEAVAAETSNADLATAAVVVSVAAPVIETVRFAAPSPPPPSPPPSPPPPSPPPSPP
eukprot:scaffold16871_cov42-Phaeocystis_antarctica.AAC.1